MIQTGRSAFSWKHRANRQKSDSFGFPRSKIRKKLKNRRFPGRGPEKKNFCGRVAGRKSRPKTGSDRIFGFPWSAATILRGRKAENGPWARLQRPNKGKRPKNGRKTAPRRPKTRFFDFFRFLAHFGRGQNPRKKCPFEKPKLPPDSSSGREPVPTRSAPADRAAPA